MENNINTIPVWYQNDIPQNIVNEALWIKEDNSASIWINNHWIIINNFKVNLNETVSYSLKTKDKVTFTINGTDNIIYYIYDEVNDIFVSPVVEEVTDGN